MKRPQTDAFAAIEAALAGRYSFERREDGGPPLLGSGGMAEVYLATDLRHQRPVAIKVLQRVVANILGPERFLQEIGIATRLTHPNILPLLEAGSSDIPQGGTLLWFAMPAVAGSLRDRLNREGELAIEVALRIAQQIAEALACAHGEHLVHRDVKPENILLDGDHVFLADFGIAKALSHVTEEITSAGLAVGTPAYMSPEQGGGHARIDARSDVYSLGCVLYEMLAGEPPFTGPSTQAIIARHQAEPPRSLRVVRPTISPALEALVMRALAKVPADRFISATAFAVEVSQPLMAWPAPATPTADRAQVTLATRLRSKSWVTLVAWLLIPVALAALVGPRVVTTVRRLFSQETALDSTRYAVLPFAYDSNVATLNERAALRDALASRWSGITLVEEFREAELLQAHATKAWTTSDAYQAALTLGAGRFVRGTVTRIGDSLRILAGLYDATRGGAQLSLATARLGADTREASGTFARIADLLVLRDALPADSATDHLGSRSLPAVQAFAAGTRALHEWNLPAADSAFDRATTFDRDFARAYLWLGLTRQWERVESGRWRSAAEQAASARATLGAREQLLADALLASARGLAPCPGWHDLTQRDPSDFIAWYGLGFCKVTDSVVIRDPRNPGTWRFRSSYYSGLLALVQAYHLHPEMLSAYREGSYAALRELFFVDGNNFHEGRSLDGQVRFTAFPTQAADSLAFEPILTTTAVIPDQRSLVTRTRASLHQRRMLLDIAEGWTAAAPGDPRALEAKGIALDLLHRRDAVDALRQALAMSHDPSDRLRVGQTLTWVMLKESFPEDAAGLERALALLDSLLAEQSPATTPDPVRLAGLASLTGRTDRAAEYLRQPRALASLSAPPELGGLATSLLIYSTVGGPSDTLDRLTRQVRTAISRMPDPAAREEASAAWLARAATLAYPAHPLPGIDDLNRLGDPL
ncbi:MAG TPA: serine/threonine-protein kinase, partial [Gemmatimonadales bacterium]|nr:serine/threonine-protein kinase [Gemmatimonadales bacterium]